MSYSNWLFRGLRYFVLVTFALAFFQNCSNFHTSPVQMTTNSGTSYCDGRLTDSFCQASGIAPVCRFNGQNVSSNQSVKAYLSSSVALGSKCQWENRTCKNGVLTGSYAYAVCAPGAPKACLFNGQTLSSDSSVKAYLSSSGDVCKSETRVCKNGVLLGSYSYASCKSGALASCLFDALTLAHGESVAAYASLQASPGQSCQVQIRTCYNGTMSGAGDFSSCAEDSKGGCSFNGQTLANGASVLGYLASNVPQGQTCQVQTRICNQGKLSGAGDYASCVVQAPASCVISGQTLPHGGHIGLYTTAVANADGICQVEDRICQNGVLSGSAVNSGCLKVGLQGAQAWQSEGCNSTSYFQDPDDKTLFWGRKLYYQGLSGENPNEECTWQNWRVGLYRADFATRKMKFVDYAFGLNLKTAEGRVIKTAYDPTVVKIGGTKYLSFECAGEGFPGSVGACGGPLLADNHLDPTKLRIYVDGVRSQGGTQIPSASVPKFTVYKDQYFLSWSQVLLDLPSYSFYQVKSRMIPFMPNMAMIASDAPVAYDIYNPAPMGTADLFSVQSINNLFWFSGARGNPGCRAPLDRVPGCYLLEIGAATSILADGALDNVPAAPVTLPDNPTEYPRWVYDPGQGWGLLGVFLPKFDGNTNRTLAPGLYFLPISNQNNFPPFKVKTVASTCDPDSQPYPNWGKKNGQCIPSCGGLGGTKSSDQACSLISMKDAGQAYDVPFCCRPYANHCDPVTEPAPNWGLREGQCLPSCGGIGGNTALPGPCESRGLRSVGAAYDAAYCCR